MTGSLVGLDGAQQTVTRQVRPVGAGRFGATQVVAVEAAVMAAAAAGYVLPTVAALAAVLVVVAALFLVVGRSGGRWWYEAVGAWLALRRRRRTATAARRVPPAATEEWAELSRLIGSLAVREINHGTTAIGLALDGHGWFAAVELTAPDGLSGGGSGELRLGWITRLAGPLSTLQVVLRQTPFAGIDPRSPCGESYRELRHLLGVPPQRQAWIAVRLAPRDAADAAQDRGGDIAGVHATLCAALARIGETLTTHGIAHRVLDAAGLRQAVVAGYGPGPFDGAPSRAQADAGEGWRRWRATRAAHLCYAVTAWPDDVSQDVLAALAHVPSAFAVSVAVAAGALRISENGDGPMASRVLVRVVTAPEAESRCQRELRDAARRLRVRLVRLDGEQGPAVYATMPTASPYGWGTQW
jgi:type VII secretion protein EccE